MSSTLLEINPDAYDIPHVSPTRIPPRSRQWSPTGTEVSLRDVRVYAHEQVASTRTTLSFLQNNVPKGDGLDYYASPRIPAEKEYMKQFDQAIGDAIKNPVEDTRTMIQRLRNVSSPQQDRLALLEKDRRMASDAIKNWRDDDPHCKAVMVIYDKIERDRLKRLKPMLMHQEKIDDVRTKGAAWALVGVRLDDAQIVAPKMLEEKIPMKAISNPSDVHGMIRQIAQRYDVRLTGQSQIKSSPKMRDQPLRSGIER